MVVQSYPAMTQCKRACYGGRGRELAKCPPLLACHVHPLARRGPRKPAFKGEKMHRVLVLGAGKIGALIAGLLGESEDYKVFLADVDGEHARSVVEAHGLANIESCALDAADTDALRALMTRQPVDAVISGLPYFLNEGVAAVAAEQDTHYLDLTEDVAVTRAVRALAEGAGRAFAPQCGLAPGFVSIAANELMSHFDSVRSVKLRVGALPQHPNNVLKYSLTWSTDGLINEYGNMCQAVINGRSVVSSDLNSSLLCFSSAASRSFMCWRWVGMAKQAGQESATTGRSLPAAKSRVMRSRT
jgi:saccharopine dehydrogenase-like NADP-dependent oxidoreductase